jgi:hypothetical protein
MQIRVESIHQGYRLLMCSTCSVTSAPWSNQLKEKVTIFFVVEYLLGAQIEGYLDKGLDVVTQSGSSRQVPDQSQTARPSMLPPRHHAYVRVRAHD